jgi:hypothetical protein
MTVQEVGDYLHDAIQAINRIPAAPKKKLTKAVAKRSFKVSISTSLIMRLLEY